MRPFRLLPASFSRFKVGSYPWGASKLVVVNSWLDASLGQALGQALGAVFGSLEGELTSTSGRAVFGSLEGENTSTSGRALFGSLEGENTSTSGRLHAAPQGSSPPVGFSVSRAKCLPIRCFSKCGVHLKTERRTSGRVASKPSASPPCCRCRCRTVQRKKTDRQSPPWFRQSISKIWGPRRMTQTWPTFVSLCGAWT